MKWSDIKNMQPSLGPNPYLFIVGCPRSGTTLLERMVNAHPQIAIIHESHWITRFIKKGIGVTRDGLVTADMIPALCNHHRFHLLKISRKEIEELVNVDRPLNYSEFVAEIFNRFGSDAGKPVVGDKTTGGYVRNIGILHALWPNARVVHLIRDGRSVCLSMLNWPKAHKAAARYPTWKTDPAATTALWWKWHIQRGRAGGARAGRNYLEMSYESFVSNPGEECRRLCTFLDLPYESAMLRFNEGRERNEEALSPNRAWRSPTTGLRDWRTQMKPRDLEMFEAIAGDVLTELGYQRAFPTISTSIASAAAALTANWSV